MKESVTYQAILEEGEAKGRAEGKAEGMAEGAKRVLLHVGQKHLGPPGPAILAAMESITSPEGAAVLIERALHVSSWEELLAPPGPA